MSLKCLCSLLFEASVRRQWLCSSRFIDSDKRLLKVRLCVQASPSFSCTSYSNQGDDDGEEAQTAMTMEQKHKLRSLTDQLNYLAKECAGRGEEWLRTRFEGFHWSIEDKYVEIHKENSALR